MTALPFSFQHWPAGIVAAAACAALIAIAAKRRPAVPRATLILAGIGALLIALASSGLAWLRPATRPVAVLVDLSPSTRGAVYRHSGELTRRVTQLVGDDVPCHLVCFGEGIGSSNVDSRFPDIPARRTVLPESDAPAVLLFSDGRFAEMPPTLPPVYVVIDPHLERTTDAALLSIESRDETVTIAVRNSGDAPRAMELQGVTPAGVVTVQPGSYALRRTPAAGTASISAALAPGDNWPENDSLRTFPAPPATLQRWWVSGRPASPGASWLALQPNQLPTEGGGYLGTSIIVLDNVSADALDDARRAALDRYVRELGGGLLILGGEHAFAAGAYAGTTLDALSPLASTPLEPTTRWLLLADASGSMNQDAGGGRTRWQYAAEAVAGAVKQLPPADVVSVGSFADDVRWWSSGKSVTDTLKLPLPPPDIGPRGPTNLEAALRQITFADSDAKLPTQLLVASDAQTTINATAELAAALKSRRITLHLLLIGDPAQSSGLAALRTIITETGGTFRVERLPENWASGVRQLLRAAAPSQLEQSAAAVRFLNPLLSLPAVEVRPWNRTWRKSEATPLAETTVGSDRVAMAARWNVGEGQVGAIAFAPSPSVVEAMSRLLERPPRDPRFRVNLDSSSSTLRVNVDAIDGRRYLNGEQLTLELIGDSSSAQLATVLPIPQTGPGRYELSTAVRPAIARVRRGGQTLDTFALPERYAPEFDAVGNDRAALADLARRTGGAVIEPGDTRRLDLRLPRRPVPLASWLATAGAALVCAGLVRWRVGS